MSTRETVRAVRMSLSVPRMATYESATGATADDASALDLYAWNAQVSGAFLAPLHICEVVIRNAVSDALEKTYGTMWPWSVSFERSLPTPMGGYNPRKDLQSARRTHITTGKVIPELKFVFWQKMFTGRHDLRLWNTQLLSVLPNLDPARPVAILRQGIYEELEHLRRLRNRIAHHEPIFARKLGDDLDKINTLVEWRCKATALWMMSNQQASAFIAARP